MDDRQEVEEVCSVPICSRGCRRADRAAGQRLGNAAIVRGEYVWHAGDPANELYVVMLGEAKDCVVDINGHEVIHFTTALAASEAGLLLPGALSHSRLHRHEAHDGDPARACRSLSVSSGTVP